MVKYITMWPEELSDNYTDIFIYYDTENKESADINVDYTTPMQDIFRRCQMYF